jgi:hypothetical protein
LFNIVLGKLHNLVAEEPLNWWPGRSPIWKLGRFFIQKSTTSSIGDIERVLTAGRTKQ